MKLAVQKRFGIATLALLIAGCWTGETPTEPRLRQASALQHANEFTEMPRVSESIVAGQTGMQHSEESSLAAKVAVEPSDSTKVPKPSKRRSKKKLIQSSTKQLNSSDNTAPLEREKADEEQRVQGLESVARIQESYENWSGAKTTRDDILQRTIQFYGDQDYRVANAQDAVRHLEILSKLTPNQRNSLIEAQATKKQINQLNQEGDDAAAIKLAQENVQRFESILGFDHVTTARSYLDLADLHEEQHNFEAAEPLFQRALVIHERVLGPDHPLTAIVAGKQGYFYVVRGSYAVAEPLLKRAVRTHERQLGLDNAITATSLTNLSELHRIQGNLVDAEILQLRALKIREKVLGPDHPDTANSLHNLSGLYEEQGNYAAALPLMQRALKNVEKNFGPNHPETATILNGLANWHAKAGNSAIAEPLYLRAMNITEKSRGPDHSDIARTLNNLAALYMDDGKGDDAQPLLLRALKINEQAFGTDHDYTAINLRMLGYLHGMQGKYPLSELFFQRALKIDEKLHGSDHPDVAINLRGLGFLYWHQNRVEDAQPLLRQSLNIQRAHLQRTSAIQSELQQFRMAIEARSYLHLWMTATSAVPSDSSEIWEPLLSWKGMTTHRQLTLRQDLKDDQLFTDFRRLTQQLSTHSLNPPLPPRDPKQLQPWKEREIELRRAWAKKKAELEDEHEKLEKQLAAKSKVYRQVRQQQEVKPADIIASLRQAPELTALVDLLIYRYSGRKSLKEESEDRIAAFIVRPDRDIQRVELGAWQDVRKLIATWRDGQDRGGAGQELRERLWKPLIPQLDGVETILISPDRELAQFPWAALPGEKPGTYLLQERRIVMIPVPQLIPSLLEQPIRTGPPESLVLTGGIDYGHREKPTPTPETGAAKIAQRSAVGRESPDGRLQFDSLPGTQAELEAISYDYPGKEVLRLTGSTATEQAFREAAEQHRWLHIATHGFFAPAELTERFRQQHNREFLMRDEKQPVGPPPGLLSGLVFAGANLEPEVGEDDGILTATEVAALDLSQVDMVVLSACETGLGAVAGGEGILGLQRSFQVAGAKTVVASLWQVDDRATQALMTEFYHNLWVEKLPRLEALRQAQLRMLTDYDPKAKLLAARGKVKTLQPTTLTPDEPKQSTARLSPQFWAGFVLSGDWR